MCWEDGVNCSFGLPEMLVALSLMICKLNSIELVRAFKWRSMKIYVGYLFVIFILDYILNLRC